MTPSGALDLATIRQAAPLPARPRPVVSIGAGGILESAHAPAYRLAGFPIAAIYDPRFERARDIAERFHTPEVCTSLSEAVRAAPSNAVFDLAVPAKAIAETAGSSIRIKPQSLAAHLYPEGALWKTGATP